MSDLYVIPPSAHVKSTFWREYGRRLAREETCVTHFKSNENIHTYIYIYVVLGCPVSMAVCALCAQLGNRQSPPSSCRIQYRYEWRTRMINYVLLRGEREEEVYASAIFSLCRLGPQNRAGGSNNQSAYSDTDWFLYMPLYAGWCWIYEI